MYVMSRGDEYQPQPGTGDDFAELCRQLQDPIGRSAVTQDHIDRVLARTGRTRDDLSAAMSSMMVLR